MLLKRHVKADIILMRSKMEVKAKKSGKKKEISNKTLAVLLVIAIVATLSETAFLVSRVNVGTVTGAATGIAKVNVTPLISISLPTSTVDFGTLLQGDTKNTTTNNPSPLVIQNDGSVFVNVSISRDASSSALFSGTGGGDNTNSFQFEISNSTEPGSFNWGQSTVSWTNVPGTAGINNVIARLNYADITDTANVELLVKVPTDEPTGPKNETLVFTASLA